MARVEGQSQRREKGGVHTWGSPVRTVQARRDEKDSIWWAKDGSRDGGGGEGRGRTGEVRLEKLFRYTNNL